MYKWFSKKNNLDDKNKNVKNCNEKMLKELKQKFKDKIYKVS